MAATEMQLLERLKKLPPSQVAEVVDFVELRASRQERRRPPCGSRRVWPDWTRWACRRSRR